MTKATNSRVPLQNVVKGHSNALPADHPDVIFLGKNADTYKSSADTSSKVLAYPSSVYTSDTGLGRIASISSQINKSGIIYTDLNSPSLTDVESVVTSLYTDSNGNKRAKSVIKIRNSYAISNYVVGVDARVYNPYA